MNRHDVHRRVLYLEYLQAFGLPAGLLGGVDRTHSTFSRRGSATRTSRPRWPPTTAATAACSTSPRSRRGDGKGSASHSRHASSVMPSTVAAATASLQSTAMAERVYAVVGFRDLGRILEYVP